MKSWLRRRDQSVVYSNSPLLASPTPNWRSRLLVVLIGLGFLGLIGRAAWLQLVHSDYLQSQGRYTHRVKTQAVRGSIVDRHGEALAISVPASSLWADPREFRPDAAQKRQLLKLLDMSPGELERALKGRERFAWVKRQVPDGVWDSVAALKIPGLHRDRENRRHYPQGEAVAHVVGFANSYEKGQEGMEQVYDQRLQARGGARDVVRDRMGRVIDELGVESVAVDGEQVRLSLDSAVQHFAYQALRQAIDKHKAKAGSAVVIDTWTGEILAMANYPSYDPGEPLGGQRDFMRNRALTDIFEPGSTMKPFVAALALENGHARLGEVMNVRPGSVVVGGFSIRDAHSYTDLSLSEVIQKSSNIGAVKLAMRMQPHEMWELFRGIGFGERPRLDFPGAATGKLRPYKSWRPIEQATMSYGYGLSASLLQITAAYTAFARDGEYIPVTLLRHPDAVHGHRVFSAETARKVRRMLQMAAGPGGTGPLAQTVGYSVGGKSGTAHKAEGKGYASNKYRSWFVGIAPIEQPRIAVGVMVDEPTANGHYGGAVAAPVFSQVVQHTLRTMGVAPDIPVTQQVVAKALPAAPESF